MFSAAQRASSSDGPSSQRSSSVQSGQSSAVPLWFACVIEVPRKWRRPLVGGVLQSVVNRVIISGAAASGGPTINPKPLLMNSGPGLRDCPRRDRPLACDLAGPQPRRQIRGDSTVPLVQRREELGNVDAEGGSFGDRGRLSDEVVEVHGFERDPSHLASGV